MEFLKEILFLVVLLWYVRRRRNIGRIEQTRDNTSALNGHAYTQELLGGNNTQCQELMRLSRDAYVLLCNHFKEKNWLQDSKHISVEEKMTIFLTTIGHNERFRMIKRRFQHSSRTIHDCFHEVREGMMEFSKEVIRPTSYEPNPNMSDRLRTLRETFPSIFNNEEEFEGHVEEAADGTQWGNQSNQYMANLRDEIANGL
ncbi:hypothetical protein CTI12_AA042130 [Artemisia annua]|uniref:DUF8040 domain-containing protein n=1 Tax=Artemisia annua TaxID=35608 RepID=A0A2U1QE04_ARTAN|nr:hypothetical protein CTI12_AA042130 [Artemisia annua]